MPVFRVNPKRHDGDVYCSMQIDSTQLTLVLVLCNPVGSRGRCGAWSLPLDRSIRYMDILLLLKIGYDFRIIAPDFWSN